MRKGDYNVQMGEGFFLKKNGVTIGHCLCVWQYDYNYRHIVQLQNGLFGLFVFPNPNVCIPWDHIYCVTSVQLSQDTTATIHTVNTDP